MEGSAENETKKKKGRTSETVHTWVRIQVEVRNASTSHA